MLAFVVALLFGAGQVYLTERLAKAFSTRNGKNILLFFAAKFLLYALGVGLVVLKFVWFIGMAFAGLIVGASLATVALVLYRSTHK